MGMEEESKLRIHSFDELIIFNVSDVFFPSLSQNNGSLVWCQNHKQCSKVMRFPVFHE